MLEILFNYKSDTTPDYKRRYTLNITDDAIMKDFQCSFRKFFENYKENYIRYVTAEEIASVLYISQHNVYKWTKNGMPVHRTQSGKRKNRYLWSEIIPWISIHHPSYIKVYERYLERLKEEEKNE